MRKIDIIAARKTGTRNAVSFSPKILIDALDRMEKRVCWLGPAYWNRSWEGLEEICSRYVLASSPLSGALSPNKHNKTKKRTNIVEVLKEYSSLLGVINLNIFSLYKFEICRARSGAILSWFIGMHEGPARLFFNLMFKQLY